MENIELTILYDSREKEVSHLLTFWLENDINFAKKKLDYGDYTFGIIEDGEKKNFENEIILERKNSIEEITQNFTEHRARFAKEFEKGVNNNCQMHIMIEDGSWEDIIEGNYESELNSKSFIASLLTFLQRYGIYIHMVEKDSVAEWMYNLFYYYRREQLKNG